MRKRAILSVSIVSVILMGLMTACGNETGTNQESDNPSTSVSMSENMDVNEEITEIVETKTEETSVGIKDYAGFYYYIGTEEIEDYEVTYTYGYLFNEDGTGVSYIQDVVDFTWDENEMHFGEFAEPFTMEQGKLTVGNIVFDKIEGDFITPNPCEVDINNIENGIYRAYMAESGIDEANGAFTINTEILTEDTYDIVDINRMKEGDAIYINGQLLYINSIDENPFGIIEINGGIENFGSALIADDESNCFVYAGMDMERSYTSHGMTPITISDDAKFVDKKDLSEVKEYTGNSAVIKLKEILKEEPLNRYDCMITIENGEIIEIDRLFVP